MCKVQMLRALVEQRLTAAAEEIFGLFERTIAEYEEELCRSKEENERQRELLDAVFNPQLRLHRAALPPDDKSQIVIKEEQQECSSSVDHQEPEPPPHIKEEQEELWSSQDGEQLQGLEETDITKFPFTPVPVKSEDEEGLDQRRTEHMETEADGEEAARNSQSHPLFPPETGDSVDSDFWKDSRERLSALSSLEDDGWNTDRTSFSCCECGKRFGKFWNLKRHVRRIHSGENSSVSQPEERTVIKEDEPKPPPHIKEEEEELFPFTPVPVESKDDEEKGLPQRQTEHTETETEDSVDSDFWKETREPQSCSNSLKQEQVPVSEERRKTDKKSLFCSECGKRFGAVGDLNRHVRTHTGEKPFSCSVCCRRFLTSTHLKTHMRTHTGEKPYSCVFCDKRFGHSGNLTEHMNMHTGEKRFSCSLCDKTFTWRQQVKKHKCVQSSQLHRRPSEDKTADC